MRLNGRVAIVTGAAQGIGEAYANAVAREGAKVAVADLNKSAADRVAQEIEAMGGTAIAVAVDIGDEASTETMAAATAEAFGGIDFLVNNAAMFGGNTVHSLIDVDLPLYMKLINVNMHGCLLATRAVVPFMKRRGGGSIVNQSSTAAWGSTGIYSVAKLGVNGLTTSLARELGPHNIRVNAIAPGPTDTPALHSVVPDEILDAIVGVMPLPRLAAPEELAGSLIYLLSDDARWVTGLIMNVDGGHHMRP